MSAECRMLREPGNVGPDCGCHGNACILRDVKNLDGTYRFWPRGRHPATYRLRKHRDLIETFIPDGPDRDEMLDYIDRQLAEFEKGEDEAKERHLRIVNR